MSRISAALGLLALFSVTVPAAGDDAVLEWNEILVATTATQNPFDQGRIATITQLAVFEAVNAVEDRYEPYLGSLTASPGASPEAAAIAAAHAVLTYFVPEQSSALDAARDASLAALPDGPEKQGGLGLGQAAATAMIEARAGDGSSPPGFYLPSSPAPGQWQTTPSCPAEGGVLFHLIGMRPFAIASASQFRAAAPPRLMSSRYTRDYAEVQRLGAATSLYRPTDRAEVARFYAAVLAIPTWNPVARQLAGTHQRSLSSNARAFALLNMAINDATIAVMDAKYHYRFWRPETAIAAGDTDGNGRTEPDPAFSPFIVTPCHPSYPSAHASLGGAARAVLERLFGRGPHRLVLTNTAAPGITLHYASLRQIARDIDDARIYGGIHYRFDQEDGARQGIRVGHYVHEHLLRPRTPPSGRR